MREYYISKEIRLLMQGDMSVATYFSKLLQLWGDEDSYEDDDVCELGEKCKSTQCMYDKKLKTRIQKFLIGLNDTHAQVRTQILATRPRRGLDETYALVVDNESQQKITKPVVIEASALYSFAIDRSYKQPNERQHNNNSGNSNATGSVNTRNRRQLFFSHCNIPQDILRTLATNLMAIHQAIGCIEEILLNKIRDIDLLQIMLLICLTLQVTILMRTMRKCYLQDLKAHHAISFLKSRSNYQSC
ncbi:hypothetical protein QQ045_000949 [Rhodiola kirilowii]